MENNKKEQGLEGGSKNNVLALNSLSIFDGEEHFLYLYKKAEKMGLAIYMITDFFPDNEPIKQSMRSSSVSLIEMSLSMHSSFLPDRKSILSNIIKECLQLISYSQIASFAGIESLMNHQILKSELESFIRIIEEKEAPHKHGKNFVLSPDFMKEDSEGVLIREVEDRGPHLNSHPLMSSVVSNAKGLIGDRGGNDIRGYLDRVSSGRSQASSRAAYKGQNRPGGIKDKKISLSGGNGNSGRKEKNDRKVVILATIRQRGGELSIKDISEVIKGCSEKTIQRELLGLVEEGLLNKAGERRWSRYSIVR